MTKKVIVIGGKGNGGVVAACIKDMQVNYGINDYEVAGFLNDFVSVGQTINGYPVLGALNAIDKFIAEGYYFIFAIHSVSHGGLRIKILDSLGIPEERLLNIVHPTAFIGEGAIIEPGVLVMANSYIGTNTRIGKCTFVMANCTLAHDCSVGTLCHFSVGAKCGSLIKIGDGCDVAINATVIECLKLGNFSVVGAGAVCINDVDPYQVVVGNPAKHLKYLPFEESREEWSRNNLQNL